jgi:glycosyltransferase involved in cell wall biosynthesis
MAKSAERIALFLPSLRGGGAERVFLDLAHGLIVRGYEVDLVLVKAEGPYLREAPPAVHIVDLGARRTFTSLLSLAHYLRQKRPAALLSTLEHANVVALMANILAGAPGRVVVREANTTSQEMRRSQAWNTRVLAWLMAYCYPKAHKVIAVSEGVAADLETTFKLPRERIQVILNPVITPRMLERAREPLSHPWFASGQPPVILGIGRLAAQKDFSTLLRAFAEVRRQKPARLMILGEGEGREALEALSEELGVSQDVSLPGFVENPFAYIARAAVFALSSAWEGLPNVLIQALALGAPVVSTDCPSGPAEILAGGKYGALVPVGDVSAMSKALLHALEAPHKPVDPNWLEQFEVETVTEQYLQALGISV